MAFAAPMFNVCDALMAEALACRLTIKFSFDLSIPNVIIEGDNLQVTNIMKSPSPDFSVTGPVLNDAKLLLSSFSSISFNRVYREVNDKADALAHLGLSLSGIAFWFSDFPIIL